MNMIGPARSINSEESDSSRIASGTRYRACYRGVLSLQNITFSIKTFRSSQSEIWIMKKTLQFKDTVKYIHNILPIAASCQLNKGLLRKIDKDLSGCVLQCASCHGFWSSRSFSGSPSDCSVNDETSRDLRSIGTIPGTRTSD